MNRTAKNPFRLLAMSYEFRKYHISYSKEMCDDHKSIFQIPISLQPDSVNIGYFKLLLND